LIGFLGFYDFLIPDLLQWKGLPGLSGDNRGWGQNERDERSPYGHA